jgi:acetolactate synthase I/II/III large subunit
MNGAQILAHMLAAYDVRYIFGVPGDTSVPFYEALDEQREALTHIMARDERSAGYMADAYARVSNRPGVVEVPSGAGAMYAVPPVAEAQGSSVPMIIITSDTPLMGEGRGVITELDCARLFEPITKGSFLVKSAQKIPEIIRRAFRVATSGRPGTVHIAVPEDILHEHVDVSKVSLHAEEACKVFPAYPARPAAAELTRLRDFIAEAKRPLLVVGGGVNRSGAAAALTAFADAHRIPVVTTITGQHAIPDNHELSIGIVGDNGFHPHANRAMEEADLLIYLGCRNGSVVSIGWTFPPTRPDRRVVQVDIDPAVLGNNSDNALSLIGDARLVLENLIAMGPIAGAIEPAWLTTLNEWRSAFWREAERQLAAGPGPPRRPAWVVESLNQRLFGQQLLFADPGTPTPYLSRFLRLEHPDSRLFIPRAFGGLGYAIPAVVGRWVARPDIRPIGLFGDGSFGMVVGELETLARLRVPAILLHFNNACFGWIKAQQRVQGNRAFMSVDFSDHDCSAIARAFGLKAMRAEDGESLEAALDEAFAYDGPVFVDIATESIAVTLPPVFNWLRKTGVDPLAVAGAALGLKSGTVPEPAQ